jgi:hypothetical protein
VYFQNGSPLSLDEQLHRLGEYQALFAVFDLYVDLLSLLLEFAGVELFLLCFGRLHLYPCSCAVSQTHDMSEYWILFVHFEYVDERLLWSPQWNWDD